MIKCCVPFCNSGRGPSYNTVDSNGEKISFHAFPCDLKVLILWIKAISPSGENDNCWSPSETSAVCSRHFNPSCFEAGKKHRTLKKGSVPTIFEEYPEDEQPKEVRKSKKLSKCLLDLDNKELFISETVTEDSSIDSIEQPQDSPSSISQTSELKICYDQDLCSENDDGTNSPTQCTEESSINTNEIFEERQFTIGNVENQPISKKFKSSSAQTVLSAKKLQKLSLLNRHLEIKVSKYKAKVEELNKELREQVRIHKVMSGEIDDD